MPIKLSREKILPIIMAALSEDVGSGDITGELVFEKDVNVTADIVVKEACVLSGIALVKWIFNALDEKIVLRPLYEDGKRIGKGKKILSIKGSAKNILAGERTALNFIGRLSGIATLTNRFVEKVKGTRAKIFDTRKTMPGFRELDKYAVTSGGGQNHRMGLWDGVLIKDNHLAGLRIAEHRSQADTIQEAVRKARGRGYKNVEIEVDNLKDCIEALDAGADIIMLDNMKIEDVRKAVRLRDSKSKTQSLRSALEVSGGIGLDNVARFAKIGVDRISVGSLTHSAPSIDFSLEIC